ncbi:MAG: hypothetical protein AMXMBFR48_29060 [Ignavibacteriales bacterium]
MSNLNIIHLTQKSGLLTKLHSDTIMGHFCWRFKEHHGAEQLDAFCLEYAQAPIFTISDGLGVYDGKLFFPKPEYISEYKPSPKEKKAKVQQFIDTKDLKGLKYTDAAGLNLFLSGKIEEYEAHLKNMKEKEVKTPSFTQGLRVSVTIDRAQMKSLDGGLYSYAPQYPEFAEGDKDKKTSQAILVRIYNQKRFDELKVADLLKEVFETGFGKKKSVGYGAFECGEFKEYTELKEPDNANGFLTLGHYTPTGVDGLIAGYYNHNIKYGRLGEERANNPNPFKKPILSFSPGSCFTVNKVKEWYGLVTDGVVEGEKNIWHFGVPLTLGAMIP